MKFSRLYILATVLAVFLTGCASARLNQFSTFAQAGITYVNASQTLLTEAGKTSINADSALLISTRPNLSTDQRLTNVAINNTLMQQRIEILGKIGRHGRLLGQYFQLSRRLPIRRREVRSEPPRRVPSTQLPN